MDFRFLKDIVYSDDDTIDSVAERLRVAMMPWIFYNEIKDEKYRIFKHNKTIKFIIKAEFQNYIKEYYNSFNLIKLF